MGVEEQCEFFLLFEWIDICLFVSRICCKMRDILSTVSLSFPSIRWYLEVVAFPQCSESHCQGLKCLKRSHCM